ncbi:MAG: FAD-dependent oxidoreductase [Clostridiales bacterium]|nr:FAD-dependent oxidoreductase [Clostridiales bacterium]
MKTVIIGGVAGGATAAARLRRLDESAEIVMIERGEHISFANCGLPYYIGGTIKKKSALTLETPESFNLRYNVDVRNLSEAVSIDPTGKTVTIHELKSGRIYQEGYDNLIISTGAQPIKPPIPGVDSDKVFTLRNIPDTYRIKEFIQTAAPKSCVVAGGGYIGVEMAENLANAGHEVTIVELADHLIAPLDSEMAAEVHLYLRKKGITVILNNGVRAIADNGSSLDVTLDNGKVLCDMIILSVGVRPDTELAKKAGIPCNERGAILVNERMETQIPDIYAVGDAVEVTDFVTGNKTMIPLAGPANKQGRIAADNICGYPSVYTGTQGSAILKIFEMTVASTGINERTACAAGIDYDKIYIYSPSHATYYPGATMMSVKVLFERKTGRILGAQIVGFEGVDKRCDLLAAVIRLKGTAYDLTKLELCYAPPFGSAKDPVNIAGFVIENILTGKVKNFHWQDIQALPEDGSVTLLDVRTPEEVALGAIDRFVNIPLDSLRQRISELDRSKPVYVHCHSGQRSYIACRILAGHGFKAYNLSGGYRLYRLMAKEERIPLPFCQACKNSISR